MHISDQDTYLNKKALLLVGHVMCAYSLGKCVSIEIVDRTEAIYD